MKEVMAVVDLQFGSTGKGQIAGTLGRIWQPDTVTSANGPNAGHTYKWTEANPVAAGGTGIQSIFSVVHTALPVTAVLPTVRNILLGPGSVVDLLQLRCEILMMEHLLKDKRLIIHPNAVVLQPEHAASEKVLVHIGSTMKGTSEAMIAKMRRGSTAPIVGNMGYDISQLLGRACGDCGLSLSISYSDYDAAIDSSNRLLLEGAQGHSLSINSQFYPHCTSRDVSIRQLLVDCRIPVQELRSDRIYVVGVCRTYPIRVSNRFDAAGNEIGHSGGCYPDQHEILWSDIGREPELTTVTKLPRRIFTFSTKQIMEAARYNGPFCIALTFCDYVNDVSGHDLPDGVVPYKVQIGEPVSPDVQSYIRRIEAAAGCDVLFTSYGPLDTDIYSMDCSETPHGLLCKPWLPWER